MAKFSYSDIEDAFLWVGSAMYGMNSATLGIDSGQIIYQSEMSDLDLPVADENFNSERHVEIPHKNNLGLGKELVFEFVDEYLPSAYDLVWNIFSKKGAYRRYKALLERNGVLQAWYDYENSHTERKIREWCEKNGVELEEELVEKAVKYFSQEHLCSQAVLMAFAPQLGLEIQIAAKIAAPFGAGIGRLGYTCGAVSGALMVIGLKYGHESADNVETKELTFELTREFLKEFKSRNNHLLCRGLLERDISKPEELELARSEGLFETRCPKFVRDAAEIVEEILNKE